MIPRRIAFFWGNEQMSWLRYMTLLSFRRLNPDWPMQLYVHAMPAAERTWATRERQDFHSPAELTTDYLPRVAELGIEIIPWRPPCAVASPVHASDIFQWQYLAEQGGVYADMDILFTVPMDEWLWNTASAGHNWLSLFGTTIAIGFLASSPGNAIFRRVYEVALANQSADGYQSAGSDAVAEVIAALSDGISRPARRSAAMRLHLLKDAYRACLIVNLGREVVYPFTWEQTAAIWREQHERLSKRCIGIHWYAGDPLSQAMNRKLTAKNWQDEANRSTFSYFAERVLALPAGASEAVA